MVSLTSALERYCAAGAPAAPSAEGSSVSFMKGSPRAAHLLGLVTLIVLATFVEYQPDHPAAPYRFPINLFLVLVVLWSTYQLMWDCTHIDDDGDPTALGLLEAAGLEKAPPEDTAARDE